MKNDDSFFIGIIKVDIFSWSPAPKYLEMATPAPIAIPVKNTVMTLRSCDGLCAAVQMKAIPRRKRDSDVVAHERKEVSLFRHMTHHL